MRIPTLPLRVFVSVLALIGGANALPQAHSAGAPLARVLGWAAAGLPYAVVSADSTGRIVERRSGVLDANGALKEPSIAGDRFALFLLERSGRLRLVQVRSLGTKSSALVAGAALTVGTTLSGVARNMRPATVRGFASAVLRVDSPSAGAVLGSRTIDVAGRIFGPLASAANTIVTVDGVLAQLVAGTPVRFSLSNFELTTGANRITIQASDGTGRSVTQEVDVDVLGLSANNLALSDGAVFAALGSSGYARVELASKRVEVFPPPLGSGSVNDLSVADGLLFLLDAVGAGRLSVARLDAFGAPELIGTPRPVSVGPFTGVSAAGGRVAVSGGTALMQVFQYDVAGVLSSAVSTIDLGVGQPDVLLAADGSRAFVSTDFGFPFPQGLSFGVTLADLFAAPQVPQVVARRGLAGAGFTAGSSGPANFAIESANLSVNEFLTAHGGGLSRVNANTGALLETTALNFAATQVDVSGDTAFVIGGNRLAQIDYASSAPVLLSSDTLFGVGSLRAVAASDGFLVLGSTNGGLRVLSR